MFVGRGRSVFRQPFRRCRATAAGCEADIGYLGRAGSEAGYEPGRRPFRQAHGERDQRRWRAEGFRLQKVFRGTIDFKNGSSDSVGNEKETVLMLGENVVNKTVPLILCAEENVVGNHGATIGELDDETLFYFESRGIGRDNGGETCWPAPPSSGWPATTGDDETAREIIRSALERGALTWHTIIRKDFPLLQQNRASPISTTRPRRSGPSASSTRKADFYRNATTPTLCAACIP